MHLSNLIEQNYLSALKMLQFYQNVNFRVKKLLRKFSTSLLQGTSGVKLVHNFLQKIERQIERNRERKHKATQKDRVKHK